MSEVDIDPMLRQWLSPSVREQSASVIQIGSDKLVPLIIVLAITAGLAIGLAVMAMIDAGRADREARMLEYYIMEVDGKLMKAGIINPSESWSAKKQENQK